MADNAPPRLSSPTASSSTDTITVPTDADIESQRRLPEKLSHWRRLWDAGAITQDVLNYKYSGFGSAESPYLVEWLPSDPRNPMEFSDAAKYFITCAHAGATLAVSFASSAYSGGVIKIIEEFHVSQEVSILGVSLFVLGFAVGPLISAPMSEMFGRQKVFFFSYMSLAAFNAGAAAAPNMAGLIVLRFLGGALGSAPLTNAGGVIADMFPAAKRGIATSIFAMAPFLGPSLGPIAGGFLGEAAGWRWVLGLTAVFSGVFWILNTFTYPETYSPVLLRKRAATLSQLTGKVYISKMEANQPVKTMGAQLSVSLSRPWALLFTEPIVLLLSIYMAIIYGTLYMCFAAFPIVFQEGRHWSPGIGGLSFVGIAIGMSLSTAATIFDNKRYERIVAASPTGAAPPEARLPPTMLGSLFIPIGLFWFAWTNGPSVHWVVPIIGSAIFASGIVLVFLSGLNYLIDSYVIYAASALAANSVLRSLFGAVFPLFTNYMYKNLGIHWASSIPAFLALVCVPFPFLFYKFGARIRAKCRYASEAAAFVEKMRADANARMPTGQAMIETEMEGETEMETELEGEARAPRRK